MQQPLTTIFWLCFLIQGFLLQTSYLRFPSLLNRVQFSSKTFDLSLTQFKQIKYNKSITNTLCIFTTNVNCRCQDRINKPYWFYYGSLSIKQLNIVDGHINKYMYMIYRESILENILLLNIFETTKKLSQTCCIKNEINVHIFIQIMINMIF